MAHFCFLYLLSYRLLSLSKQIASEYKKGMPNCRHQWNRTSLSLSRGFNYLFFFFCTFSEKNLFAAQDKFKCGACTATALPFRFLLTFFFEERTSSIHFSNGKRIRTNTHETKRNQTKQINNNNKLNTHEKSTTVYVYVLERIKSVCVCRFAP